MRIGRVIKEVSKRVGRTARCKNRNMKIAMFYLIASVQVCIVAGNIIFEYGSGVRPWLHAFLTFWLVDASGINSSL